MAEPNTPPGFNRLFDRGAATISGCARYRYDLIRTWGEGPKVLWIMLNPSTADADLDDPTIRRCIGFSKSWGYAGLTVVNLYALRATDPKVLLDAADPIGPDNAAVIKFHLESGAHDVAVAAWGAWWRSQRHRPPRLNVEMFAERAYVPMRCLGKTKAGDPRHPLYVKADALLHPWEPFAAVQSGDSKADS